MPWIRAQLSKPVDEQTRTELMESLSKAVARALGKPESYMMVVFESGVPMLMGTSDEAAAFLEIRSVGTIHTDQAKALSGAVSDIIAKAGVDAERIYSNFVGVPGAMWGHGGNTFG